MEILQLADYQIVIGDFWKNFHDFLKENNYAKIFILLDDNTEEHCFLRFKEHFLIEKTRTICIRPGELHKNLQTSQYVWQSLFDGGCDRKSSLFINLGGGVIGDMGGFCASTFKRGIDFIQIPTTLLSMVDSSIGGKLGIDFYDVKNSIGVFANPKKVFISTEFLTTLSQREVRSGFAEIFKHALIQDAEQWYNLLTINDLASVNWDTYIVPSLKIKQRIVEIDPFEKGLRKALNYGHTIGHAIESMALATKNPLTHGEAIAIGMICEAYLSKILRGMPDSDLKDITDFVLKHYGKYDIQFCDNQQLITLMKQDKKNESDAINFSLLNKAGDVAVNCTASIDLIVESLGYYRGL
jgi:3-dehydroquinate synthase